MKAQMYRVYIYSPDQDFSFIASVNNGIAVYKGFAYLVVLSSDGKRYYGAMFGPEVTEEYTTKFMQEWLAS